MRSPGESRPTSSKLRMRAGRTKGWSGADQKKAVALDGLVQDARQDVVREVGVVLLQGLEVVGGEEVEGEEVVALAQQFRGHRCRLLRHHHRTQAVLAPPPWPTARTGLSSPAPPTQDALRLLQHGDGGNDAPAALTGGEVELVVVEDALQEQPRQLAPDGAADQREVDDHDHPPRPGGPTPRSAGSRRDRGAGSRWRPGCSAWPVPPTPSASPEPGEGLNLLLVGVVPVLRASPTRSAGPTARGGGP